MDPHNIVQWYVQLGHCNAGRQLTALGHVHIWSYITQSIVKTFELTDVPVRAGRFIARKNWIVAGGRTIDAGLVKDVELTWPQFRFR